MGEYICFNCRKGIDWDQYSEEWFHLESEQSACNSDDSPGTSAEPDRD